MRKGFGSLALTVQEGLKRASAPTSSASRGPRRRPAALSRRRRTKLAASSRRAGLLSLKMMRRARRNSSRSRAIVASAATTRCGCSSHSDRDSCPSAKRPRVLENGVGRPRSDTFAFAGIRRSSSPVHCPGFGRSRTFRSLGNAVLRRLNARQCVAEPPPVRSNLSKYRRGSSRRPERQ